MDINTINDFLRQHWVEIVTGWLAAIKLLQAIRDAIDKTPTSDDNWFEKLVTVLSKAAGQLLLAQRPK